MSSPEGVPQDPSYPQVAPSRRRLLAPLLAAVAGLAKAGGLLLKLKAFTLVGSMLLSVGAYALLYGWRFAVGLVVLIGIHEMGHVVVLRARGIDAGLPVFLPFLGAFVAMKEQPRTAWDEALSGLAGPVVGTAGAFAALGLADVYDSQLLRVLAYVGFFVNLVNLLPVLPLDGGRTVAALSPRIWLGGLAALLAYEVWRPSPVVPLVLVVGGVELYRRWKGRDGDYYALAREQRLAIGSAYVGMVVLLLWAMHAHPLPPR